MSHSNLLKVLTSISVKQNGNRIEVIGSSMEPSISSGNTVCLEKVDQYRKGDIVVAIDHKGRLLIHRIVRIKNGVWYIKGDNAVAVETVKPEDCFGRVVKVSSVDGIEKSIKPGVKGKVIACLSLMMHKKFVTTKDYKKVMRGWEYKMICFIARHI